MIVEGYTLGEDKTPYLIAEISANHNGSLENAKLTIQAAKQAGANAVKIQTYTADTITIDCDNKEFILKGGIWDGKKLYDLYKDAHTPYEWHKELFEYAKKIGITLFSTPFDNTAVDLLEELKTPAYKVASFEIVDHPLIERIASTKKPMFMSTGAASVKEIHDALSVARKAGAEEILLFHCISSYPAPIKESNLAAIKYLKDRFGLLVGLSDHTIGSDAAFLATALGASAIEKHFIADRSIGGPDSTFSANPEELKDTRIRIDLAREATGKYGLYRSSTEKQSSTIRKSIYFIKNLKKGSSINKNNVKVIRPGKGIHPKHLNSIIGEKLSKNVSFGDPVTPEALKMPSIISDAKDLDFKMHTIKPTDKQLKILFELLKSRNSSISHKKMPSFKDHVNFVKSHPYRKWWLISSIDNDNNILGAVYIGFDNSLGIQFNFEKVNFSASFFFKKIRLSIAPLKEQKSKIYKDYFVNVSPKNKELINWLKDSGFEEKQKSYFSPDLT